MSRATRSGKQFSPYELSIDATHTRPFELAESGVLLDEYLHECMVSSDLHAQAFEDGCIFNDDDDEEWEDVLVEVISLPPSPLTSSAPSSTSDPSSPGPIASELSLEGSRAGSPIPKDPLPHNDVSRPSSPLTDTTDANSTGNIHHRRQNQQAAARRRARRKCAAPQTPYDRVPDSRHTPRHREQSPHHVGVDIGQGPPSSGGAWTGLRTRTKRQLFSLPEVYKIGCRLLRWDGRSPKLIVDGRGRIVAILIGRPEDADWDEVVKDALKEMHRARRRGMRWGVFKSAHRTHRRGTFFPLTDGVSFGGGQKRPGNLAHSRLRRCIIRRLLANLSIRRWAGFQSSALATYAPKLYRYYCTILKALFDHHPGLVHTFSNSVFPAVTFNLGRTRSASITETISISGTGYALLHAAGILIIRSAAISI
ncbi:hypothetical protein B0H10DRAFT_1196856 [Mycena sp. CBHHK59/15]|nr:hypothetical protein B0H10DRAFT_1196856 [Mycena sp. CBHHK59/15]